jgi:hypothetical protein
VALGRGRRRTERAKIDATPPWETRKAVEVPVTTGPFDISDAPLLRTAPGEAGDELGDEHVDADPDAPGGAGAETAADDESSAPAARIDFGCLQVPVDSGLELRVEVTEAGVPSSVTLSNPQGTMQLGVFAAPRTEGIWDDVRAEIRDSLIQQGGKADDATGPFGTELVGRLPQNGNLVPVRFLGVDGPRWFVRAMLVGPAAADKAAGKPFESAFRRLVVVRGDTPLPVREPVPLALPKEIADRVASTQAARAGAAPAAKPSVGTATIRRPRRT